MGMIDTWKKKIELHKKRKEVRKRFGLTGKGLKEFEQMAVFVYENSGINLLNMEIIDLTGEDIDDEELEEMEEAGEKEKENEE